MTIADRVAARYTQKKIALRSVPMGKTMEKGALRVHRFRDNLSIWDLTNAGKRGKKVQRMYLSTSYSYEGDEQKWLERMSSYALDYGDYKRFKAFITDIQKDSPGEIELSEYQERGIDVLPGGTATIELKWKAGSKSHPADLRLTADPLEFRVNSSVMFPSKTHPSKGFRQDTLYSSRKKADAKRFYIWLADGGDKKVQKLDITGLRDLWHSIKVQYDFH